MKIAFIGGGNMGEAMLSAILDKRISTPRDVSVSDINESRLRLLEQKYGIAVNNDNLLAIDPADIVILAIKPQNLADVMAGLNGNLKPHQLVVSIIAGARIDTLCQGLKHDNIIRCMPNTPAQIGAGMTVWTATSTVTDEQKDIVHAILGAMGKEIFVDDEKYMDMATAISASGPAYFFLFVESLVESATYIGLPRETAGELVLQTMLGAAYLIQQSGKSPAELRKMVTSPGGTTAEALNRFEKGEFRQLVLQAVTAAYDKAKELGEKKVMALLFDILELICTALIYAIIIRAVLSWFVRRPNMLTILLDKITEPILYPLRRIIPHVGMMDLSPLVAILLLQLIIFLIP